MLLNLKNSKEGMKVLLTHPDEDYVIGHSNPATGTKYECFGIINSVGIGSIRVIWDNGTSNTYKEDELSLIDTGIIVDMWEEMYYDR